MLKCYASYLAKKIKLILFGFSDLTSLLDNMEKNATEVYIPAFYAGRSIFITGGTGFMGKVLIEKLLRSCPDVGKIFVLIRPKKGQSINDRLQKMD